MKPPKCICIDNLAFSLQNIHVSFLRTVPPYSHQVRSDNNDQNNDRDDDDCSKADVWVELLQHFHYRQLVFIHSSDTDGRSLLGRLVVHPNTLMLKYQIPNAKSSSGWAGWLLCKFRFQTRTQDLEADDQVLITS